MINCLVLSFFLFNLVLHEELSPVMSDSEKFIINFLLISALVIHFCLKYSDPGFVNSNQKLNANLDDSNYCDKCNLKRDQSNWVGHCPICSNCVLGRDHHCFYVDNCIGFLNHKIYLVYLLNLDTLFIYTVYSIYKHLSNLKCNIIASDSNLGSCLFDVYYSNFSRSFLTLLFIQLGPIIIFSNVLLVQQYFFIGIGRTQYQLYKMSQKNFRFSLSAYVFENFKLKTYLKNMFYFCRYRSKSNMAHKNNCNQTSLHDHFI
jgi:hypothetical protein